MGKLQERYAQAVNSDCLTVDARTTWSDTDVVGAAGLASKNEHHALGIALMRLFADGKPDQVVAILTELAHKRSYVIRLKIARVEAEDLAKAVLGWYRHGVCQPCGGTGYKRIADTPALGDECPCCKTTGRMSFDRQFSGQSLELARWLSGEIERSQAAAGSAAMALLAPRMEI